jgi:hypothetical protein
MWFVIGILWFQKWFDVDMFDFKFKLCFRYYGFFWLLDFFGLHFEKLGNFFLQNFWSHCKVPYFKNKWADETGYKNKNDNYESKMQRR